MSSFKILITSQKGGVGKSTVAANLAAFVRRLGKSVTLIDFDTHASSSNWLNRAPEIGVSVQHHLLPLEQGGKRPILDARLHLRRAAERADVVICDLTWTDAIASELMLEFDLVIVPTSVSEIELSATAGFLNRHRWVFDAIILHSAPTLLMCPTRVHAEQLRSDVFSNQRFPVSFMLAPPVLEAQSARDMFERGYLMDLPDACGASFNEFGKAVMAALDMRQALIASREANKTTTNLSALVRKPLHQTMTSKTVTVSSQASILGRHRLQKMRADATSGKSTLVPTQTVTNSLASMRIPQFFKRMSMGMSTK
jgi:cellulose biosynthesis protein BcsQ